MAHKQVVRPVKVKPSEYLNPAAAQQVLIRNIDPITVLVIWPTGAATEHSAQDGKAFAEAWGLLDTHGNWKVDTEALQQSIDDTARQEEAMQAEIQRQQMQQALMEGIGNGQVPPGLRPLDGGK